MRWTEQDLSILRSNPNIKVIKQGGAPDDMKADINQNLATKASPKYRNKRIYLYESDITSSVKDERLGKLIATYDSEKEFVRHRELKLMELVGLIFKLERQVPIIVQNEFIYHETKVKSIIYKADFKYTDTSNKDCIIIEDVKGFDSRTKKYLTTKDFDIKWKILKYKYPEIDFRLY